jgi:hypothetical protein
MHLFLSSQNYPYHLRGTASAIQLLQSHFCFLPVDPGRNKNESLPKNTIRHGKWIQPEPEPEAELSPNAAGFAVRTMPLSIFQLDLVPSALAFLVDHRLGHMVNMVVTVHHRT